MTDDLTWITWYTESFIVQLFIGYQLSQNRDLWITLTLQRSLDFFNNPYSLFKNSIFYIPSINRNNVKYKFSMHSGAPAIVSFDMTFSPLISSTAWLEKHDL